MENLCRLCAIPKQVIEFKCKINDQNFDIEQKLVTCCNWNSYRSHHSLPQNVCTACYQQLEQCWYFSEMIARAQQKLCSLMQVDANDQSFKDIQVKEENLGDEAVPAEPVYQVSTMKIENDYDNYPNDDENDNDIGIDNSYSLGNDDTVEEFKDTDIPPSDVRKAIKPKRKSIVAPVPEQSNKRSEKVVKDKVKPKNTTPKMQKQTKNVVEFDIKSVLTHVDVNENGTIKPEKVQAQNFCNWATITSRCYKCHNDFDTDSDLWVHFTSTHSNEKLKFICPICPEEMLFLSGRYYRCHIAKSHFPYLAYW